jgi:hypothetical protein
VRSRYGVRELLWPQKYWSSARHNVVVTFSSSLAHVYFADSNEPLELEDIARDPRRAHLYASLLAHPGIGLLLTRMGEDIHAENSLGRARLTGERWELLERDNPLAHFGTEPAIIRSITSLLQQANSGDIVIFGAYDGYDIISYDDQVGAHGSAGGDQVWPFLVTPPQVDVSGERIEDAKDIYRVLMTRWMKGDSGLRTAEAVAARS